METRKFKIIIIDNEEETERMLLAMLKKYDDIIIAAHVKNASTVLKKIVEIKPDLVFLAVSLPKKDGFSILDALKKIGCNGFEVVFLTEGCEHAQKTMQKCAFDFLSKPLKTDELEKILLKFRVKHSPESKSEEAHPIELHPTPHKKVRVLIPQGYLYVDPDEIACIQSIGKHTMMTNSENKEQKTCIGLKKLVSTFHDSDFVLVHKSYAINRRYLQDVPFKYRHCTLKIGDELVTIPLSWRGKKRLK